jgi:hypothetical protein|tara:strand:+ start:175 stop:408 length:234 start_codon:yes stop_codon:yes gene_type:complete
MNPLQEAMVFVTILTVLTIILGVVMVEDYKVVQQKCEDLDLELVDYAFLGSTCSSTKEFGYKSTSFVDLRIPLDKLK